MTTRNDDDRTMTARNTVGIPCPEIEVPERNLTFEEFLEGGAFLNELRKIPYHDYCYAFQIPFPPSLEGELAYLRYRYFISDEEFLSEFGVFYSVFDGGAFSAFLEDWVEDPKGLGLSQLQTLFGPTRMMTYLIEENDWGY